MPDGHDSATGRRRRRFRIPRSASLRFSLGYGVLFALSSILFMSFIWWGTIGFLERQVETAINADARALSQRWAEGGLPTLALTIDDRLEQNLDDDAIYLMVDPSGHRLAGNLSEWPAPVVRTDAWYALQVTRAGMQDTAQVHAFDLPGGFRLLVGRDIRARAVLRRLLTDSLLWAWMMVTLLAVSGAVLVHGMFRRMIKSVAQTTSAIAHGDLSRRMPLVGNGDELDQVAEAINEMLDRIVRLMDGVRQVSNAIAHDLRTPITRARTQLEDAALHAHGEDELRAAVERAVGHLDNVTAVFEALLRIAQIEAGSRRSAFAPFDLAPLLVDVGDLYEAVAEERQIRLVLRLPPSLPFYGDSAMMQQAVANLLDNAIKFSPAGGTVTLAAALGPALPGLAMSAPGRNAVSIAVTDEGIGMNEADLARASERFFRAETARNTPGAGLGLSLVQAIVQLHGGVLRLRAQQPGLSVRMILPVARQAARPRSTPRPPIPIPPVPRPGATPLPAPPGGVTETSQSPNGGDR
ncbi:two component sensor histidine kinase [Gluconacetobacter johannae DSM 13595]|uniref:histidine kinase n=1 Tax=Gluconacetobacter johannae TaxID=112140 RepID=A0A7W4P2V6_9PROT|nr:HAMP domain-containing sensor histidine kinase [Gluconacetobacter johannae]MBB2175556.1 HAMP domain-containing histidine kinase [Gluconacetobacter johannae]GBQ83667.1 two component sensor histidine kinase [Gluconacetobacter johannae DSM 13595]